MLLRSDRLDPREAPLRSILLVGTLLAGCGSTPAPVGTDEPTSTTPQEAAPVVVTEADAGKPVALVVGQEVVVRVQGNPSTGYAWSQVPVDGSILATGVAVFESDEKPAGMVGVGGTEVLRFRATAVGTETLTLRYARPWETDTPPAMELSFPVTVK